MANRVAWFIGVMAQAQLYGDNRVGALFLRPESGELRALAGGDLMSSSFLSPVDIARARRRRWRDEVSLDEVSLDEVERTVN